MHLRLQESISREKSEDRRCSGDLKAANDNGALFFPVIPGDEDNSWKLFHDEALARFIDGTYRGEYQDRLIEAFRRSLPENPAWEKS
jgi:hypothetical protein